MQEKKIIERRCAITEEFSRVSVRSAENHYFIADEALSSDNRDNNCPPWPTRSQDIPLFEGSRPEILDIFYRSVSSLYVRVLRPPRGISHEVSRAHLGLVHTEKQNFARRSIVPNETAICNKHHQLRELLNTKNIEHCAN